MFIDVSLVTSLDDYEAISEFFAGFALRRVRSREWTTSP